MSACTAGSSTNDTSPTATTVDQTSGIVYRPLPADFLGINGGNIRSGREAWSTPEFRAAVADLGPQAIRLFGGTTANFWDWRAGDFSDSALLPESLRQYLDTEPPLTLDTLAEVVTQSGAEPIYVLNMVTSTLANQIAMLDRAQQLGLPVRRIELGNELAGLDTAEVFPSGTAYAETCNEWIEALTAAFPGVEIAVAANAPQDDATTSSRKLDWSPELFAAVRGADGAVFHAYFGGSDDDLSSTSDDPESLIDSAAERMDELTETMGAMPVGMSAWITEFNLLDPESPLQGTWAQGVAVASFALSLAADPRVDQADVHTLIGTASFGALFQGPNAFRQLPGTSAEAPRVTPLDLSTTGVVMDALFSAFRGATEVGTFTATPLSTDGERAPVLGAVLVSDVTQGLLLNRSADVVEVDLPPELQGLQATTTTAEPLTRITGRNSVTTTESPASTRLQLPPYSLTTLSN